MTNLISYRVYYEIGWPHCWFSNFLFHLLRYAKKSLPYLYFEVSITIICQLSNFLTFMKYGEVVKTACRTQNFNYLNNYEQKQ